jgi:hypothetical protein
MAKDDGGIITAGGRGEVSRAPSFLEAVGIIEQVSSCEIDLPAGAYPMQEYLGFSNGGALHALKTTVLTFAISPVTMLVLDKYMRVFGNETPSMADKVFAILLSCAPALGFAMFIAFVLNRLYVKGRTTKNLLKYYLTPYIVMKFAGTLFMFMLFLIISYSVLTTSNVIFAAQWIHDLVYWLSKGGAEDVYEWSYRTLHEVKTVMIRSAVYSTCIHVACVAIIAAAYIKSYTRSWLIDLFSKDFK